VWDRVYNFGVPHYEFGSPEFDKAAYEAGHQAFLETLAAGLPVFYVDDDGINAMLFPDGRKFEIRWIDGAPSGENYQIIREVTAHAA
jgi:hypothetical protein